MFSSIIFPIVLILATVACALVAGLLFAFAIVTMPGIKRLNDGEFIRAFQAMDGIIQNNQPLFVLVWVGSVVAVIASALLGLSRLEGPAQVLILLAAFAYVVGVQVPTVAVNVPLNNRLQAVNVDALDPATQQRARLDFEPRWNRWNAVRTVVASLAAAGFMLLLLLL